MSKPRILIMGVGRLGEALARIIAPTNRAEIALFDIDTAKTAHSFSLPELAVNADYIFFCIPASAMRESLSGMAPVLPPQTIVISCSKGLDPTTTQSMHEVLTELLGPRSIPFAVLGGPMLSAELVQGRRASGCAGTDAATFVKLQQLLQPTLLQITHSLDGQGVAMAGVLKNIYAIGLGIAAALELGDNVTGQLVQLAVQEMQQLLPELGGQAETALTLAGLGDLVATGCSVHSRNRSVGQDIVQRGKTEVQSEGLIALPFVWQRLGSGAESYPWLLAIKAVVVDQAPASETFTKLLTKVR